MSITRRDRGTLNPASVIWIAPAGALPLKKIVTSLALAVTAALTAVSFNSGAIAQATDPANTLVIETKTGKVNIQLLPNLAPLHVERVKMLAGEGFYNNIKFHRVINNFMAQTGDPKGTGSGGSKYPDLPAEFSSEPFTRGTVAAARTNNPNSANSQFFICFNDNGCKGLQGQYTIWGRVTSGMENIDQVAKGEPPSVPDVMQKVYILAPAKK
jgi:peptidylprolyl isomerase